MSSQVAGMVKLYEQLLTGLLFGIGFGVLIGYYIL